MDLLDLSFFQLHEMKKLLLQNQTNYTQVIHPYFRDVETKQEKLNI